MKFNKLKLLGMAFLLYSTCTTLCAHAGTSSGRRRWRVRPINRKRDFEGTYATLVRDLWRNEEDFFGYCRMSKDQFEFLLNFIYSKLEQFSIGKRMQISARQRLIITLHFLAEGCSMREIAWNYRIGRSTASYIIRETCSAIWKNLQPLELPQPSEESFTETASGYWKRWNLPNCIGALDGKHIEMIAPPNSGSQFFNYKKTFSIVLMATCDAFYRFTMIDVGGAGSNHDAAIFKAGFGSLFLNKELDIPAPKNLPNSDKKLNHFLVADAAFPLHENIIRPYPGNFLGEKLNICNYRLSRGRRCIENSFGILSSRWRILLRPIQASLETVESITLATVVLHNYLQNAEFDIPLHQRKYCPTGYADFIDDCEMLKEGTWRQEKNRMKSVQKIGSNNYSKRAKDQRDILADFFVSEEGWLPWQETYVNRNAIPA